MEEACNAGTDALYSVVKTDEKAMLNTIAQSVSGIISSWSSEILMFGDDFGLITCQNFLAFLVIIRCKYISGRSYMFVLANGCHGGTFRFLVSFPMG